MFGDAPLAMLFVMALYVVIPVLVISLAYRFVRAYERRGTARDADRQLADRVAALEDQVARLTQEHERLADGQQFTNALLASRAAWTASSQQATPAP